MKSRVITSLASASVSFLSETSCFEPTSPHPETHFSHGTMGSPHPLDRFQEADTAGSTPSFLAGT